MLTRNLDIGLILGVALAGLALGGAAGWTIAGWRAAGAIGEKVAEIRRLEGVVSTQAQSIATLEGANGRCTAAVGDVKGAVKQLVDEGTERSRRAQAASEKAAREAVGMLKAARAALDRPMPKAGEECAALQRELLDYAKRRKAAP